MNSVFYYILCNRSFDQSQYEWKYDEDNYIFYKVIATDWKDAEHEVFERGVVLYGNCPEITFKVRQIAEATYERYSMWKRNGRINNEFITFETRKSTLPVYVAPEIILRKTPESYIVSETEEIIDFFNETNKLKNYNDD